MKKKTKKNMQEYTKIYISSICIPHTIPPHSQTFNSLSRMLFLREQANPFDRSLLYQAEATSYYVNIIPHSTKKSKNNKRFQNFFLSSLQEYIQNFFKMIFCKNSTKEEEKKYSYIRTLKLQAAQLSWWWWLVYAA